VSGIGLDLLDIERLERALERRPRLAQRLFSEQELEYAARHARPARHLAARFCAKEAVSKALEMDALRPRDIEVVGGGDGPPRVVLRGEVEARAAALGVEVHISLTHTKSAAGAVAVLR
jgi:holo-[acyl-carrier protein] synthase